jgi:hypothetical protein
MPLLGGTSSPRARVKTYSIPADRAGMRLPTRALAPVIALAILGGIVATFMVYRTLPSGAEATTEIKPRLHKTPVRKPVTKKAKPVAKTPVKPLVKPKAAVKPKTKPVAAPVQPPVRKPVEAPKGDPVDGNGLPLVLARTLARHPVTVVALYDPDAAIDQMALAEARAGAVAVNAGFLALNIRHEPQVRPLAQLLGVLETPSVLVYERPNTLFARLRGFSDRETVAQAAANARQ